MTEALRIVNYNNPTTNNSSRKYNVTPKSPTTNSALPDGSGASTTPPQRGTDEFRASTLTAGLTGLSPVVLPLSPRTPDDVAWASRAANGGTWVTGYQTKGCIQLWSTSCFLLHHPHRVWRACIRRNEKLVCGTTGKHHGKPTPATSILQISINKNKNTATPSTENVE